ncbi:MAG: DUF2357 domain-containing protein [Deltaproteobacteria bacterium]|nr:DUF2357 domain-containing protein [Kofleriaceae bacterium]
MLWEWREYIVTAEGADSLRVGTQEIPPIVPSRFLLRFENRVGFAVLQPLRLGALLGPARRVEVISAKLGGHNEYRAFAHALVRDLHQHGAEKVFDFSGMTAMSVAGPVGQRGLLLVMHFLLNMRASFLEALGVVVERPHLSLVERRDVRRLATISSGGRGLVDALVKGRRGWDRAEHIPAGVAMGGFLPTHVDSDQGWETADNPENRFVLALLAQLSDLIDRIRQCAWWPKVPQHRSAALIEMQHAARRFEAHPVFLEVGTQSVMPTQSRVLTRREGYRQLFTCWSHLNRAASPLLTQVENAIEVRDVDLLYEQWCFFDLAARIGKVLQEEPRFVLSLDAGPLAWKARAEYPGGRALLYNVTRPGYSLPFRPDLLWMIEDTPTAVFDAKFRAELPNEKNDWSADPKRDDLDKMHAYRDALGVASATVLYPGTETRWYCADSGDATADLSQLLEGWRGIGALPLRPEPHDEA